MLEYEMNEVFEYANDLKREYESKDDVENYNQAIMRLRTAVEQLSCIDSFEEMEN